MAGAPLSGSFTVAVAGTVLPAEVAPQLVSVVVEDNLNLPDVVVLRFRDPGRTVLKATGVTIGAALTVGVVGPAEPAPVPLIEAEVTAVEAEIDSTGTFTVVRGYDKAHRLFRGRHTDTYVQSTASDVAKKVAARAGLPVGTVEATSTVYPHLSQGGVSDWQFLSSLAREIGYEVAVRQGKLDFRRPRTAAAAPPAQGAAQEPGPLVLQQGSNLVRLRAVVTSSDQVSEVEVRGWDVTAKRALVAAVPAATTSAELPSTTPVALAEAVGGRSYVATDVPYGTQAEVDGAAAALADQIAGSFAEMDGVARGNPRLRAGAAVSVDSLGAPFDGKYVVTTSRHVWEPVTGYTTHFSVTGRQERSLLGLASGGGGAAGAARGLSGVVSGQVSDVRDPLEQGRVTVTFPWLSDSYVSDWARTVQPGAGRDRGAMVVPEVGDEVLVAFEQGDMRRPYVVGGLYNGVDLPGADGVDLVDRGSGAVNRRSLVSRRGHRLDLLDQDGRAEGVRLRTGDGKLDLLLDATGTKVTVHSDGTVVVEGTRGVTVDAGSGALELKGRDVTVTAQAGLTLKGARTTLEGSAQTEVKGGAQCAISAALVRIN